MRRITPVLVVPAALRRAALQHSSLSLAIALSLCAPTAFAQDADAGAQADRGTLDAITVTARKREETIQDVPVAVTAFTADSLDKLNVEVSTADSCMTRSC